MLLELASNDRLLLRDDHGDIWQVNLAPVQGGPARGAADTQAAPGPRTIRFQAPGEEALEVPYEGDATALGELTLDDVVEHFLLARD